MEKLIRFLPASIGAVLIFLTNFKLGMVSIMDEKTAQQCQYIGLLLPACWLAAVGPKGLIKKGGFLMRLFKIKSDFDRVAVISLFWLGLFLVCQIILKYAQWQDAFWSYWLYALSYAGLMGVLGVYIFIAIYRPGKAN